MQDRGSLRDKYIYIYGGGSLIPLPGAHCGRQKCGGKNIEFPGHARLETGQAGPGQGRRARPRDRAVPGRAGQGQASLYFFLEVRKTKRAKRAGRCRFLARSTEEKKLAGRAGPGPGRAGLDPKRTARSWVQAGLGQAGSGQPGPSHFCFHKYGKRDLMTHGHIYIRGRPPGSRVPHHILVALRQHHES